MSTLHIPLVALVFRTDRGPRNLACHYLHAVQVCNHMVCFLPTYTVQHVSNTLWALATLQHHNRCGASLYHPCVAP